MVVSGGPKGERGKGRGRTTGEVGVNVVGLEEHRLADLELDVVQEESDEEADVVRELAVEAHHQVRELLAVVSRAALARELGTLGLRLLDHFRRGL